MMVCQYSDLSSKLDEDQVKLLCLFKNSKSDYDFICLYDMCITYLYASPYLLSFPISVFVLVSMCIYFCFPQAIWNVIGELNKMYCIC